MFQSLVGTLKTLIMSHGQFFVARFQSLVGTLKTEFGLWEGYAKGFVSIPRRYAKNDELYAQGRTKPGFQSLVGTLKTRNKFLWHHHLLQVSIPRRYAKNLKKPS